MINSPTADFEYGAKTSFAFTATDVSGSLLCNYSLNGAANISIPSVTSGILKEVTGITYRGRSLNTLKVYCKNPSNKVGSGSVTFNVVGPAPRVEIITPSKVCTDQPWPDNQFQGFQFNVTDTVVNAPLLTCQITLLQNEIYSVNWLGCDYEHEACDCNVLSGRSIPTPRANYYYPDPIYYLGIGPINFVPNPALGGVEVPYTGTTPPGLIPNIPLTFKYADLVTGGIAYYRAPNSIYRYAVECTSVNFPSNLYYVTNVCFLHQKGCSTIPPCNFVISIYEPDNGDGFNKTSDLTSFTFFTYSDSGVNSCEYNINGGSPTSISAPFGGDVAFTPVVGSNALKVTCRDGDGHTLSDTVTFTVCSSGEKWDTKNSKCEKEYLECDFTPEPATTWGKIKLFFQHLFGVGKANGEIKNPGPSVYQFCWNNCSQGFGYHCRTPIEQY